MGSIVLTNSSLPLGAGNTKPVPHLEIWGRLGFGRPQRKGRAIVGWGTGRASAFGCLVTGGFGPLGPVLDLTRIPCRFSLFGVFTAFDSETNGTPERSQASHRGRSGHEWNEPGVEFLNLGLRLTRE